MHILTGVFSALQKLASVHQLSSTTAFMHAWQAFPAPHEGTRPREDIKTNAVGCPAGFCGKLWKTDRKSVLHHICIYFKDKKASHRQMYVKVGSTMCRNCIGIPRLRCVQCPQAPLKHISFEGIAWLGVPCGLRFYLFHLLKWCVAMCLVLGLPE